MKLIAVDNEHLALQHLLGILAEAEPEADIHGFSLPYEALDYVKTEPVDVAFLDIEMQGMNGLKLAKQLKDIRGKANIVFVTAYSQYAVDAFSLYASGYILKPASVDKIKEALENLRNPVRVKTSKRLTVKTFGNFEVFVDGEPLYFPRSKSKELFAYLIHKRGTGCSTREISAILFEDRSYGLSIQKQIQTIRSTMMKTLKDAGVQDCIFKSYNRIAIDITKVDCDYYRFIEWDMSAINEYMGEYMTDYSWAEFVIGYLNSKVT